MKKAGERIFSRLPTVANIKKNITGFHLKIDQIYDKNKQPQHNSIAHTIYDKLTLDDPYFCWEFSDYSDFKRLFANIALYEINFLGISIQRCLDAPSAEIYRELKMLSQECLWYQREINKQEINKKNNQYGIRGIHLTDCFSVIITLQSYMKQHIRKYISTINAKVSEDNSIAEIINIIKNDKKIQADFLDSFKAEFQFITDYPLFKDVYFKVYQQSIDILYSFIYDFYGSKQMNIDIHKLNQGVATPYAQNLGKHQLHQDIKSENRSKSYIHRSKNPIK